MKSKKQNITTVEILNRDGEWCKLDVEIREDGTLIDLHPDETHLYPSIFISKDGRWQDERQRLISDNAHLALNIKSDFVREVGGDTEDKTLYIS